LAALISLTLLFVTMDATTPINCQVGAVPFLLLAWALTITDFSSGCFFQLCAYLPMHSRLQDENAFHFINFFLAISKCGLDCHFAIDNSSYVCLYLKFNVNTFSGNQLFINSASIVIWNRNRVIVALTTIVLGISVGVHLYSKPLPLTLVEPHLNVIWSQIWHWWIAIIDLTNEDSSSDDEEL